MAGPALGADLLSAMEGVLSGLEVAKAECGEASLEWVTLLVEWQWSPVGEILEVGILEVGILGEDVVEILVQEDA